MLGASYRLGAVGVLYLSYVLEDPEEEDNEKNGLEEGKAQIHVT